MFFPEKIVSIKDTDRVLEVGPGATPYHRSDVLLEKVFDEEDAKEQRGHTDELKTNKELIFYEGDKFPFEDNEFDYVICSHVLEHIPEEEIEFFISELQRVAKRGYIEYPTIYYEYLYNFKVHTTFLNYTNNILYYMSKSKSYLNDFYTVQIFFYKTLEAGYDEIVRNNKEYFFQGFEWDDKIKTQESKNIDDFTNKNIKLFKQEKKKKNLFSRILRKFLK